MLGAAHLPKPLTCLNPKEDNFDILFVAVVAHTIALNIIYEGFFSDDLIDNNQKGTSPYKHTYFKARVQKPYPISDQTGQN